MKMKWKYQNDEINWFDKEMKMQGMNIKSPQTGKTEYQTLLKTQFVRSEDISEEITQNIAKKTKKGKLYNRLRDVVEQLGMQMWLSYKEKHGNKNHKIQDNSYLGVERGRG